MTPKSTVPKYDNLTKQLEETRDKKNELLTSAELPLPELSVKDGELIYKGQKWTTCPERNG